MGALTLDGDTAFELELELGLELELALGLLRLERRSVETVSTAGADGELERDSLLVLGALLRGAEVVLGLGARVFFVTTRVPVVSPA